MPESALAEKLQIKSGMSLRLLAPPSGLAELLMPLPAGAHVEESSDPADFVLLFAASKADLDAHANAALACLKSGGVFWVAFPKGSSNLQTDLTRDRGWDSLSGAGWQLVSLVSIDAIWSAARIRPIPKP